VAYRPLVHVDTVLFWGEGEKRATLFERRFAFVPLLDGPQEEKRGMRVVRDVFEPTIFLA
jgi:hypothetical protein